MRKILFTISFMSIVFFAQSQNASVEKSTNGIQTGVFGIWFHHESKLSNKFALRSEVGFDGGIGWSSFSVGADFLFVPSLTAEPRYYYNLDKRLSKSKRIDGNSGNFISLRTSFFPDWFVISNYGSSGIIPQISLIPTWGIRRGLGDHFNYEAGIGIGYRHIYYRSVGFLENEGEAAVNLHLRFGYRF